MKLLAMLMMLPVLLFSAVDYTALANDSWTQLPLSGGVVNEAGDVHWACDSTGNAYIFGACSYGGQAGGTHNSDCYRFNLQSGAVTLLSSASNNKLGWTSACQNGIAFDKTRNCLWIGNNTNGTFWKYQCPNGPLTQMASGSGGQPYQTYLVYDNVNDLVYVPSDYTMRIYNCKTNTWKTAVSYPFSTALNWFDMPVCFDSKRGLFVITLAGGYGDTVAAHQVLDVWFYNGGSNGWSKKTPATRPAGFQRDLAYDAVSDKYVYFGGSCPSELWLYDYDSNTWSQVQQKGRAFNDANLSASTWPPARGKHCWGYSTKYNACVNWGGGQWADAACTDYDAGVQPIWIYRLSKTGTGIDASSLKLEEKNEFTVFPNPFHTRTRISFPAAPANLKVFNAAGALIYRCDRNLPGYVDLNAEQWPAGMYFARLLQNGGRSDQRLIVVK
jgi:hypothetical protein